MKNFNIFTKLFIIGAIIFLLALVVLIRLDIIFTTTPVDIVSEEPVKDNQDSPAIFSDEVIDNDENIKGDDIKMIAPISDAVSRVTKKPFGIYITPQTSPVSPEKFSGYHTGVDFEIREDEQDLDIAIFAICDGPLLITRNVSGYGGVAVQSCEVNTEPVTVLYGHLDLSSIDKNQGVNLLAGDKIGILGEGYSLETSGERKHLHLGVSKGGDINYTGYVKAESDLEKWLDLLLLLK